MKRLFSIIMIMTILVSMTACADNKIKEPDIIEHDAVLSSISESTAESRYITISENSGASSRSESSAESTDAPAENGSAAESTSVSSSKQEASSKPQSESSQKPSSSSASQSSAKPSSESSSSQKPQNNSSSAIDGEIKAVWISYLEYQSILAGKSEKEFKSSIKTMFANLVEDGFNTVYVHARSHSDAYYASDLYPWSVYCTWTEGKNPGFDPLEIMVKEAHSDGLKIEAWINPYRVS